MLRACVAVVVSCLLLGTCGRGPVGLSWGGPISDSEEALGAGVEASTQSGGYAIRSAGFDSCLGSGIRRYVHDEGVLMEERVIITLDELPPASRELFSSLLAHVESRLGAADLVRSRSASGATQEGRGLLKPADAGGAVDYLAAVWDRKLGGTVLSFSPDWHNPGWQIALVDFCPETGDCGTVRRPDWRYLLDAAVCR